MLPTLYRPFTRVRSRGLFDDFDYWSEPINWFSEMRPVIEKSSRWSYKENENEYVLETTLPVGIDTSGVKAEVRDGVLKIIVPKPEATTIEIEEVSTEDVESVA